MALSKLWNAVFGKRTSTEDAVTEPTSKSAGIPLSRPVERIQTSLRVAAVTSVESCAPQGAVVKPHRKKLKADAKKAKKAVKVDVVAPPTPVLKVYRKKQNAWSKLIGSRTVGSILDINFGDGKRATDILEAIVEGDSSSVKYVAIGMFEMAPGGLSIRQFHQLVRTSGGQPIAIPMPLGEGLRRLSETLGTVDLIVLDADAPTLADPLVIKMLSRVTSAGTLTLRRDANGRLQPLNSTPQGQTRRAA